MPIVHEPPLAGVRIVEFAAIGPAPFAAMLLADLGAEVLRIGRADAEWPDLPVLNRGRASLNLDLKTDMGQFGATAVAGAADILIEGFRPGVMERLGLGPDVLLHESPRLIYGRITGWGQDGPLARTAGHDLNFIALTGLLDMLGRHDEPPRAPQNLLGDYAAGGLYLALGILAALHERERSGRGQVIDAAIVDGAASLLAPNIGMIAAAVLPSDPACGVLAGDAPFYRTYRCADGRFVAVAALERRFRATLAERLGIAAEAFEKPEAVKDIEAIFAGRSRDAWMTLLGDVDCCVSPVLDLDEARAHPHNRARANFLARGPHIHPAPAPRFSRTACAIPADVEPSQRLREWGLDPALVRP
jgi:alpha-methylacyl-CoA racemase